MKPVTATLVASLGFLVSGCSVEQVPQSFTQDSNIAAPGVAVQLAQADADHAPRAADAPTRSDATLAPPGNSVRDAKEATEDAARRIADATVNAANKIREVGVTAIQALRDPDQEPDTVLEAGTGDADESRAVLSGG